MRIFMYEKYHLIIGGSTDNTQILTDAGLFYNFIMIGGMHYIDIGLEEIYCSYIKYLYEINQKKNI